MKIVSSYALILIVGAALAGAGCGRTPRAQTSRPQVRGIDAPTPQARATVSAMVVVEVFGTPGARFGGVLSELGMQPKSVEGTVPTRLTLETGAGFRVALQKRAGDNGELGIAVSVNGRQVSRSTTKREFGVVTFTHRPTAR
jgi:hypothetical protein